MTGRDVDIPDPERRRAANAALAGSIDEVCRHYALSGARAGECWEVSGAGVALRVFLSGPMRGSWTDAATGARGDALELVARLCGLDAAGGLAEAERFLGLDAADPERAAPDGGQMTLFAGLPEDRERRRKRRSGRRAQASPQTAADEPEASPIADPSPPAGDDPETAAVPPLSPEERPEKAAAPDPAPEERMAAAPGSGRDAGAGSSGAGQPSAVPEGIGFSADDRQLAHSMAADISWVRSWLTPRFLDGRAHERAKARKAEEEKRGRRRRGAGMIAASCLSLFVTLPVLGVTAQDRYDVMDRVARLVVFLDDYAQTVLRTDDD